MNWETAKKSVDFILPLMKKKARFSFSGGEPFLEFLLMKKVVSYLESENKTQKKSLEFAVSTNGSLLTDPVLDFLYRKRFQVELSFDGFSQNSARRWKSFERTVLLIKKILGRRNIILGINSTFTSTSIVSLSESIEFILRLGVKKISVSLDLTGRWNRPSLAKLAGQISRLRDITIKNYLKTGAIPVSLFKTEEKKGLWLCPAGSSNLTVTPSGEIWGCPVFYEYFKGKAGTRAYRDYYFGHLEEFTQNDKRRYREACSNYLRFRMDNYYTANSRCFLCPLVEKCGVCPVIKKSANYPLLYVPSYICEVNKILIGEREKFLEALKKG